MSKSRDGFHRYRFRLKKWDVAVLAKERLAVGGQVGRRIKVSASKFH
jgi:phosphatidylethanolamine-binding protein (PEBP) family uncharacterized protein